MNSPSLISYFDEIYNSFSIKATKFYIPDYVDFYTPDNQDDFNCTGVLVPNPNKGAKKYTHNGKIISIGIYRDEGRPTSEQPIVENIYWYRIGKRLFLQQNKEHEFLLNDEIQLYNVNVESLKCKIVKIFNSFEYEVETYHIGDLEGYQGACKSLKIKNFYEENIVFRLLPCFNLLKLPEVYELLGMQTINNVRTENFKSFIDITTNENIQTSNIQTKTTNFLYNPNIITNKKDSYFYHNQIFDEFNNPLKIQYRTDGKPEIVKNVDSKYKNKQIFENQPLNPEIYGDNDEKDSKVFVFDFYGFLINDENRLPYKSNTLIKFDENSNIGYEFNNLSKRKYDSKFIHDLYGNKVIKITNKNTTIVQKQILPLELDRFNKPIKKPLEKFINYELI